MAALAGSRSVYSRQCPLNLSPAVAFTVPEPTVWSQLLASGLLRLASLWICGMCGNRHIPAKKDKEKEKQRQNKLILAIDADG